MAARVTRPRSPQKESSCTPHLSPNYTKQHQPEKLEDQTYVVHVRRVRLRRMKKPGTGRRTVVVRGWANELSTPDQLRIHGINEIDKQQNVRVPPGNLIGVVEWEGKRKRGSRGWWRIDTKRCGCEAINSHTWTRSLANHNRKTKISLSSETSLKRET